MPHARPRRLAFDTGGTFTDLTVDGRGLYKAPTTADDPVRGVLHTCDLAAADLGLTRRSLLEGAAEIVYGTTQATNAVLAGATARTALLATRGHPDLLLWREGGRVGTFDFSVAYPEPYVPRHLTFEVPERIGSEGQVVEPLDEAATIAVIARLEAAGVEAVAVCLLWSILEGAHERRVGELLESHLPGVPYTLSHRLNPSIREYRRASAAAIDASLKPLMAPFLGRFEARLADEGFAGRLLVVTSTGGVLDAAAAAEAPIHTLSSGPAVAPVAGRRSLQAEGLRGDAIVTDAGGTSFEVSLVRDGTIPWTQETRIGRDHYGAMTGFPSIDVTSVGAGGGSVAAVEGGMLRVGPRSAGAVPGPACYGADGVEATVTDACVVLGYLDPDRFLDGAFRLDADRARTAVARVGEALGLGPEGAAEAILEVATERMVNAVEDIAIGHGVDPRGAVMVSGGGSGGFFACAVGRRLGCRTVLIPEPAAALSAVGAFISDLVADFAATAPTSTDRFETAAVLRVLGDLRRRAEEFVAGPGAGLPGATMDFSVEARYPQQIWDLEIPLRSVAFDGPDDVCALERAFHARHQELRGVSDEQSPVQLLTWRVRVRCAAGRAAPDRPDAARGAPAVAAPPAGGRRRGHVDLRGIGVGATVVGPLVIHAPATTIVLEPGAVASRRPSGALLLVPARR